MSAATPRTIDFRDALREPFADHRDEDYKGRLKTAKQARARARRALKRGTRLQEDAREVLGKPVEEWDMEELARGRPRAADGSFRGKPSAYVTRELHERALVRFKDLVRSDMNARAVDALHAIGMMINSEDVDRRGRLVVAPMVRLQAAQWLVDHVIGKPRQPIDEDISVRLEALLGVAMVHPDQAGGFGMSHQGSRLPQLEGTVIAETWVGVEDDDDEL